jgi:hypothetical protein
MKFYIRGGIGDFLQSLWFVRAYPHKDYIIHSHFKKAKEFYDHFGVNKTCFYPFDDFAGHNEQVDAIVKEQGENSPKNIQETPRAFYSAFDFGEEANNTSEALVGSFKERKDIIAIHPFRSGFALSVYASFDLPARIIPLSITKEIINNDNNYLIFGSKEELSNYGLEESDNVKFVSFDNILHSLNTVKYCSKMIGVDSCFKTMSSMQKISTICLIGDFPDQTRDAFFIDQYVNDGYMKVMKVKDIVAEHNQVVSFIKENLA